MIRCLRAARLAVILLTLVGCSTIKPQQPPDAWQGVNGGMTREEISHLIGSPTRISAQGGDLWVKAGWELQIDYDQYGRARNIFSQPVGK